MPLIHTLPQGPYLGINPPSHTGFFTEIAGS